MVESRLGTSSQENFVRDPIIDQHSEVVKGLNDFVEEKLTLLPSSDRLWQPSTLLPDLNKEDWKEKVQNLKEQAKGLSPDLLVVVAGAKITEDGLPIYPVWLNRFPAISDETGTDNTPWARWTRAWTAEENRHGDVIDIYMRLSGRFNMLKVEQTTQNLIRSGFDPKIGKDPYKGLIFVSVQEPGTYVSHSNAGSIARKQGDETLANIFTKLSGDEARHTAFYQPVTGEIFREDPNDAVIAFRDVVKQGVNMPGMLMTQDGILPSPDKPSPLYQQLTNASIRCEAYTPFDFMRIFKDLMNKWKIAELSVSGDGAKAQDDLGRMLRVYERALERFTPKQTATATNLVNSWLE